MLADVRAQFGITSGMAGELEACGDALRVLAAEADGDVRSAWHDAKLRAVGGTDRDKKLLAMRHLDESDYEDEALLAGVIDSLTRDEQLALTFGMTSAMNIDPSRHEDAIRLLFGELAELERRGQSRAANFATTIEQAFEEHPAAVVPRWLIDEWARVVGDVEDPSSFAALIDLCALAVLRSHDVSMLEQWLRKCQGPDAVGCSDQEHRRRDTFGFGMARARDPRGAGEARLSGAARRLTNNPSIGDHARPFQTSTVV